MDQRFSPPPPPPDVMWPLESTSYSLLSIVGRGAFASVYAAYVNTPSSPSTLTSTSSSTSSLSRSSSSSKDKDKDNESKTSVHPYCAIKLIELESLTSSLSSIRLEISIMRSLSHPSILPLHGCFVRGPTLWMITELMNKGSCLHALQSLLSLGYPPGFAEPSLIYIIYQTLLGLKYFHATDHIHRDIKAGNILLSSDASVKLADFGVSGWLNKCNWIRGSSNGSNTSADGDVNSMAIPDTARTFVGTPCWMAPEVMEQLSPYTFSADIWSLGITMLELAKGYAPYAHLSPMKVLLVTIQEDAPGLESYGEDEKGETVRRRMAHNGNFSTRSNSDGSSSKKTSIKSHKFSKAFSNLIQITLQKDPSNRPSASTLLEHKLFKPFSNPAHLAEARDDFISVLGNVESINGDATTALRVIPPGGVCAFTNFVNNSKTAYVQKNAVVSAQAKNVSEYDSDVTYKSGVSGGNNPISLDGESNKIKEALDNLTDVERPAGTTWVFDDGVNSAKISDSNRDTDSNVDGTKGDGTKGKGSAKEENGDKDKNKNKSKDSAVDDEDGGKSKNEYDFFDDFEMNTGGENYAAKLRSDEVERVRLASVVNYEGGNASAVVEEVEIAKVVVAVAAPLPPVAVLPPTPTPTPNPLQIEKERLIQLMKQAEINRAQAEIDMKNMAEQILKLERETESAAASAAAASVDEGKAKEEDKVKVKDVVVGSEKKDKESNKEKEDEMSDFFDEFEQTTQGEYFTRRPS